MSALPTLSFWGRIRLRLTCLWHGHPVWNLYEKGVVPRRKTGEICMRCGKVWRDARTLAVRP